MNKLRFLLSLWVCKGLIWIGKIVGKKGSSTPGSYALKICPDVLKILSKKVRKEIIAVCGTNGKTTTNNIIYKILTEKGYKTVCNNVGANMLPGVVTAFISSTSIFGKLDCDYAAIEMDEASARNIFGHFIPDIMVITNLFRDQLDRYGEIDITVACLKEALKKSDNIKLVLNGDDPICASIGRDYKNGLYFGIDENLNINLNETKEGQFCAYCRKKLQYSYYHYSQLGDYHCSCGFKRPRLDYSASRVDIKNGLNFLINNKSRVSVPYRGIYNIYNILAAIAVCDTVKVDLEDINTLLSDYKPQIGRMEKFDLGKPVILNLAKNPAGFNQAIFTALSDENTKDIIVMINDNPQDGTDISWIWDVDFEKLASKKVLNLAFTGIRGKDVAVRFKYADIGKTGRVYDELKDAITDMVKKEGDILYVLVNYTAIFDAQKILKSLEESHYEA